MFKKLFVLSSMALLSVTAKYVCQYANTPSGFECQTDLLDITTDQAKLQGFEKKV